MVALDSAGKILGSQQEIAAEDLPNPVTTGLDGAFPKCKVNKAVAAARGDKVVYLVRVAARDDKVFHALVDASGKVLKQAEVKAKN